MLAIWLLFGILLLLMIIILLVIIMIKRQQHLIGLDLRLHQRHHDFLTDHVVQSVKSEQLSQKYFAKIYQEAHLLQTTIRTIQQSDSSKK